MNQLQTLIESVKEENLSKDLLEKYHTQITYLDNLYRMELAEIEKTAAIFFAVRRETPTTDIALKRRWQGMAEGQRQIELSHYLKVTPKLLQSIKTRLYSIY